MYINADALKLALKQQLETVNCKSRDRRAEGSGGDLIIIKEMAIADTLQAIINAIDVAIMQQERK